MNDWINRLLKNHHCSFRRSKRFYFLYGACLYACLCVCLTCLCHDTCMMVCCQPHLPSLLNTMSLVAWLDGWVHQASCPTGFWGFCCLLLLLKCCITDTNYEVHSQQVLKTWTQVLLLQGKYFTHWAICLVLEKFTIYHYGGKQKTEPNRSRV